MAKMNFGAKILLFVVFLFGGSVGFVLVCFAADGYETLFARRRKLKPGSGNIYGNRVRVSLSHSDGSFAHWPI